MVGSVPAMPSALGSETLLATTRPIAPAACTLRAFSTKSQVPRSTSATFPATSAASVSAEQASVVDGPATSEGSSAATSVPGDAGDRQRGAELRRADVEISRDSREGR